MFCDKVWPVEHSRMFVFVWTALLFSMRGSHLYTGAAVESIVTCDKGFCITLPEELTAEAGLCVVIPCSYSKRFGFRPLFSVWYKCSPTKRRCGDTDIIYHSNPSNRKTLNEFRGRVSLLEPDVSRLNCSVVINDLQESDSGAYQFRVNALYDGWQFTPKVSISVKGLSQKPTVEVPPLTEGREATLTCAAPGLCSGSVPNVVWTWSGASGSLSGNITTFKTERLNVISDRHVSTLTFNSSAEHHATNITCRIGFSHGVTTEETVTLNVTYIAELEITGDPNVKEQETLNLTCSVDSFPPSRITWMKRSQVAQNGTGTTLQDDTSADLLNETATSSGFLLIYNVTTGDSGLYICIANYLNTTTAKEINVSVTYRRNLRMTGNARVIEGDVLNMTCSVESLPPSFIVWAKLGCNATLLEDTGSATLLIPSATPEDSGLYVCTATYLGTAITAYADLAVTYIHKSSGCELQSDVLTCVCISEGLPLPGIQWPLLNNHTEYLTITSVSNHTVNSTVVLTVKTEGYTSVECVSRNENGEVKKSLPVGIKPPAKHDPSSSEVLSKAKIVIAFLIGVLLSAIISYVVIKCYRRKQNNCGNLDETVELVTKHNNNEPLLYNNQAVDVDPSHGQEEAGDGAVDMEETTKELEGGSNDVEYANIDFSLLKRKSPVDGAGHRERAETEYAEIKKEVKEGGDQSEMLEEREKEAAARAEETQRCLPEEESGEMEAVYSNVTEAMNEI